MLYRTFCKGGFVLDILRVFFDLLRSVFVVVSVLLNVLVVLYECLLLFSLSKFEGFDIQQPIKNYYEAIFILLCLGLPLSLGLCGWHLRRLDNSV